MSYVLVDRRKGCVIWEHTFAESKRAVWEKAYAYVAYELGWGFRYWKRWDASLRAARRAGFKIEKCTIQLL